MATYEEIKKKSAEELLPEREEWLKGKLAELEQADITVAGFIIPRQLGTASLIEALADKEGVAAHSLNHDYIVIAKTYSDLLVYLDFL